MDFNWARELGLIRKPASFMTTISDERGQELLYAGMPISAVLENGEELLYLVSMMQTMLENGESDRTTLLPPTLLSDCRKEVRLSFTTAAKEVNVMGQELLYAGIPISAVS